MTVRYDDVLGPLREAYDARAGWRDGLAKEPWKLAEREVFRRRLAPGARLLEVGAGTGQDSAYFMDFLHLNFPLASFDAVFAMNCLLHVPNDDLPAVLAAVRAVLHPGGLLYVGVYGGTEDVEGPIDDDDYVPPRFFSWRTDRQLLGFVTDARFDVADFHTVDIGHGHRLQSLTVQRTDGK